MDYGHGQEPFDDSRLLLLAVFKEQQNRGGRERGGPLCVGLLRLSQSSGPQNRAMHGGWRVDPRDSRVTGEQEEFEGFFLPFPSL